jgi:hypothetical protein
MDGKVKFGFQKLAKQTLAVLTASLSSLLGNQTKALPVSFNSDDGSKKLNYENFQKKILRPKLVLKLNLFNPEKSFLVQHSSHSSHSSHASHASYTAPPGHYSHSSHSSHMSSSPSYTPSSAPSYTHSTPAYTPSTPVYTEPKSKPSTRSYTSSTPNTTTDETLSYYTLGSRVINKDCQGTDVEELQQLLLNAGYDVLVTGYFGDKTEIAVKKFQRENELKSDGKVGNKTLKALQNK